MKSAVKSVVVCIFFICMPAFAGYFGNNLKDTTVQTEFLTLEKAFKPSITRRGANIELVWEVAPGYYLYKSKFEFELLDEKKNIVAQGLSEPSYSPAPVLIHDEFFGDVFIYSEIVEIRFQLTHPEGSTPASVQVQYQGCAEAGLCYPPSQVVLKL